MILDDLKNKGFTPEEIKDFLCDGEALKELGYTDQDEIEAAFWYIKNVIRQKTGII